MLDLIAKCVTTAFVAIEISGVILIALVIGVVVSPKRRQG